MDKEFWIFCDQHARDILLTIMIVSTLVFTTLALTTSLICSVVREFAPRHEKAHSEALDQNN